MAPKAAKSAQSQVQYIFGHAKLENKNDFWSVSFSIEVNDGKRIGRIVGRSICRNNIRSSFWTDMQRPSATTKAISDELFDRWGCVLGTYLYGQHKGTGVWNSKLNDRCLFLLESLDFTGPASATANVVHELITRFSDHATDLHEDIGNILVNPALVNKSSLSLEEMTKHLRASGFRRVGDSNWLARSIDANHAARSIPEASDFDQAPPPTEYELFMKTFEKQRTQKVIKNPKGKGTGGKVVENSDNFKGHSTSDVQKLLSLRGITAPTEDEANQAKYGCTCGLCLGGFISPRMAYILSQNSSYNFVALVGLVECESHSQQWQSAILGGIPFCGQTDLTTTVAYKCWEYIPGDAGKLILTLLSKDAARGHYQIFNAIDTLIRARTLPTSAAILGLLQAADSSLFGSSISACNTPEVVAPTTNHAEAFAVYQAAGGTLMPAIDRLFHLSHQKDEKAGDDTFHWDSRHHSYSDLPRCRNDSEYGFVKKMLVD